MNASGWREGGVLGVVVHPRREIDKALEAARRWTEERGGRFAQVTVPGQERRVADPVEAKDCDLVLAVGGDGTVLAALRSTVSRPATGSRARCPGLPCCATASPSRLRSTTSSSYAAAAAR